MAPSLLITDPTGSIGRLTLDELEARGVPVRATVRSKTDAARLRLRGVDVTVGDPSDPAVMDRALTGISRILLTFPPSPDHVLLQGTVIEAVERARRDIHVFSVSALGAIPVGAPLRLARWQMVTDAQLKSSGLRSTILRPHFLMQSLLQTASSIQLDGMICGSVGEARVPLVDGRDVANAAATLLTSEGPQDHIFVLTGPQALSFRDVASTFSRVLNRPVRYVDMPVEMYHEYLVGSRIPTWIADDLTALARSFQAEYESEVSSDIPRITGRPARTLAQFIRDHADAFRPGAARVSRGSPDVLAEIDFWSAMTFPPTGPGAAEEPASQNLTANLGRGARSGETLASPGEGPPDDD